MSFTQDELHAFNMILEQKLALQRREFERAIDQRMTTLRREFEQRLSLLENLLRNQPQRIIEQRARTDHHLLQKLDEQQTSVQQIAAEIERVQQQQQASVNQIITEIGQRQQQHQARIIQTIDELEEVQQQQQESISDALDEFGELQQQQQQQFDSQLERAQAAQLQVIEQILNERLPVPGPSQPVTYIADSTTDFGSIEVQTEIPWDDLVDVVDKALDKRLAVFNDSMRSAMKDVEHYLSAQLHNLREDLLHRQVESFSGNINNLQEVIDGIDQLEHVIESMQVAMNANHALLSNRLYHHQNLPLERAHPTSRPASNVQVANGAAPTPPLPLLKEHEGADD
jgi:phage-related tail protein